MALRENITNNMMENNFLHSRRKFDSCFFLHLSDSTTTTRRVSLKLQVVPSQYPRNRSWALADGEGRRRQFLGPAFEGQPRRFHSISSVSPYDLWRHHLQWVLLLNQQLTGCVIFQEERRGHTHQDPEHWRLLRSLRRRKVRHPVRAGAVLYGKSGSTEGKEWRGHWAQIPSELCRSHHRKVSSSQPLAI